MDKIVEEGSIHVKLHTKKPPLEGEALVNLFCEEENPRISWQLPRRLYLTRWLIIERRKALH